MGSSSDWIRDDITSGLNGVAVDLPGHGKSVNLPDEAYDYENVARLLRATLIEAGITEMDLVGYSLGGRIALGFTRRFPAHVRHLVLESTSPGIVSKEDRARRAAEDAVRADLLRSDHESFQRDWLSSDLFLSLKNRPEIRNMLIRERLTGNAKEWARALVGLSVANQPDFRSWLAESETMPSFITGALDQKYTDIALDLNRKNKRIRHIPISDAGHNVHLEQPEVYLRTLKDILVE